ncbi:retrovirus-related pol polyprotein from transposon TNT 1-94 [Tanacetum coccineum]
MPVLRLDLRCLREVAIYHGARVVSRRYHTIEIEKTKKWLNKAIDDGPYEFRVFSPSETEAPRMQKQEDLRGDDLKRYEAEIKAMNLILISIPNDIYNSVDACTTAKAMCQRVERLMRGTVQNQVDRETRFNNKFDQFVAEPGEALVSVYNHFAHFMNDLERNHIIFPKVTINIKKTGKCIKRKEVEKSHDTLALVAHRVPRSRTSSPYDVHIPSSVVDYDDDYQGDTVQNNSDDPLTSAMILLARAITQNFSNPTNNRLRTSFNTRNQAIVQGDKVNIQSKNSGTVRNVQCYNCSEKGHYAHNYPKPRIRDSKYFMEQMLLAKQDEAGVIFTDEQNDFLFADVSWIEEIEELSANICLMARIQPANIDGSSNDYAFLREVQTPSTSYVNLLFAKDNQEQKYLIGSVENNNNVQDSYELEQLARNAYKKAEKQQIIAKKADQKAKRFEQESQSQFIRHRDIIRDSEQQRDKLDLNVVELKRQSMELQKTQSYHDTDLNMQAKNVKQKTYAYADVRAQNQDLLIAISELRAKLKNVKNGKSVNTKFDKANVSKKLLSVNPLNKQVFQKKLVVPKTEEKHVLSKTVTLQTLPNKQQAAGTNKNVIAPGMYKVGMSQVTNTNKAKSVLSSTGMSTTSSVRIPSNRDSLFKNNVISNTKNSSKKVEVSDRTNKKPDVASKNVALNTFVTNDEIKNALIAKNVLCVSCAKNVLIPCHDNCLVKYKLNVHSNVRRALFTTPRTV